jgi:hypothetical protein
VAALPLLAVGVALFIHLDRSSKRPLAGSAEATTGAQTREHHAADEETVDPAGAGSLPGAAPGEGESGSLMAPPSLPDTYSLDGAQVTMRTSSGSVRLQASEGLFERVWIHEDETLDLHLTIPGMKPGKETLITASSGGRIERRGGALRFPADANTADLDLSFTPTLGRGAYSVDIRHAGSVVTLAFWAGDPAPAGEPGPADLPLPPRQDPVP